MRWISIFAWTKLNTIIVPISLVVKRFLQKRKLKADINSFRQLDGNRFTIFCFYSENIVRKSR
eukprot:UN19391